MNQQRMIAITRQVSHSINNCQLTYLDRQQIDLAKARQQHQAYEAALVRMGCRLIQLPEEPDLPDSVFVEDIALVFPEVAVLTYPGADSRLPERETIRHTLQPWRTIFQLESPARLDGGDVLVLDREVYIGLSSRSNQLAVEKMQNILQEYGYSVKGVSLSGCLHLKSAVTQVAPNCLLLNPNWIDRNTFSEWDQIEVAPEEDHAANALLIGGAVLYPAAFPATAFQLQAAGISLEIVDLSELAKAEGAVTCCSLVFQP